MRSQRQSQQESIQCKATDAIDGEVSCEKSVAKVDDEHYSVSAKAVDKAGNEATATATITIVKPEPVQEVSQSQSESESKSSSISKSSSGSKSSSSSSSNTKSSQQASNNTQSSQKSSSNTQSSSNNQQPASQPEQPSQPSNDGVKEDSSTFDQDVENTWVKHESWDCGWCGAHCTSKEEFHNHVINVHGIEF